MTVRAIGRDAVRCAILAIAGLAALGWSMASSPDARGERPWIALLGPLRPFVAELVRLRFEAARAGGSLGQLDDAWTVLALEPERVDDFDWFAACFIFDAPHEAASQADWDACVNAGFEILARGRALHPRSTRLAWREAQALEHLARRAPERGAALQLAPGETLRSRALARFEEAHALSRGGEPDREFIRLALALAVEDRLLDPATPAALREQARRAAGQLLREADLPAATRAALEAALGR